MNPYNNNPDINMTPEDKELLSEVISVRTVTLLHPISPIQYKIQVRSIEKTILHLGGITKSIEDIGIKTIDRVLVYQKIFFGRVRIIHMDNSEIIIDQISKSNTILIKEFFEKVVEFQRRNVVNIAKD
jgi:hypothetical protein